jgi:hypothetical protein
MRVFAQTGAAVANAPPAPPTGLSAVATTVDGEPAIEFSWNAATDDLTPPQSLSYNLRVGTLAGGHQVVPALALSSTGLRLVPAMGNAGLRTSRTLRMPPGTYHWSVQAIDGAFAGSAFAPEQAIQSTVGVGPGTEPAEFALLPPAPNPFEAATALAFQAPRAATVRIEVFDLAGRRVRTLLDASIEGGRHSVTWDGRDAMQRATPGGVYLVRMSSDTFRTERRVVRMR